MSKARLMAGAALIGVGLFVNGWAQAETLEEVLATAYATNPTLEARRAQLRATDEGVPQALSGWRPTVRASGDVSKTRVENNAFSGDHRRRPLTPKDVGLQVTQPLYSGGRTVAQTRQNESAVLAQRALLQAVEGQVLLNAATAYINVVRDEAVLKLNISNQQVLTRQLDAAKERFRVGEITRTDVSQAEARQARAVADRVAAEGALQGSRATFINVVGRAPESPKTPKSTVEVPTSYEEIKSISLAKNPNIIAADWTAQAAKEGIDLVQGELLPSVNLNGRWDRSYGATDHDSETSELSAQVQVVVPLYEGGETYSRVRAQKHTFGQRKIEADQARRDALESATQGWENLQAARASIRSFQSQIKASELALSGVEEEAKVGSRTVLDVLDAEQELFVARVNLVRAKREEFVSAFQLKSALGQMTAEGLGLPVTVYDPTEHYNDVKNKWIGTGITPVPSYDQGE